MANSLNKAFIKAYSKGGDTSPDPQPQPEVHAEDFILRIDTMNVPSVPPAHLYRPREEVVSAATVPQRTTRPAEKSVVAVAGQESAALRDSIADQMVRASEWREAAELAEFSEKREPSPIQSVPGSQAAPADMGSPGPAPGSASANFQPVPEQTRTPAAEAPDSAPLSSQEVQRIVGQYVQRHGKHGEIFRLDKPSYMRSTQTDAAVDTPASDDGDNESLLVEELPDSQTDEDLQVALQAERVESARIVEADLRRARVRVFNPVWEVDRLQWPAVCIELIRQQEESLLRIASNLRNACDEGLQVLAVTSSQAGEGRTTVACCLARLAAISGLRVAFVDGDLDNPTLAYQTNLELDSDWKMALADRLPIEEIAVHSIEDQVTLIPLLEPVDEEEFAADDDRIAAMLRRLTESFDLVLIDAGPLDSIRTLITPMCAQGVINAVVHVVDYRVSTTQSIESSLRRIRSSGVSSVGLVENFAA
jgi:Mrp family chromosome partitioning ATPase